MRKISFHHGNVIIAIIFQDNEQNVRKHVHFKCSISLRRHFVSLPPAASLSI